MNARQRRSLIRDRHMSLPVGKELDIRCLLGRLVYVLGKYQQHTRVPQDWAYSKAHAKLNGHLKPHNAIVVVTMPDGEEVIMRTHASGLRLKNPADRAPRPWWCDLKRRNGVRKVRR